MRGPLQTKQTLRVSPVNILPTKSFIRKRSYQNAVLTLSLVQVATWAAKPRLALPALLLFAATSPRSRARKTLRRRRMLLLQQLGGHHRCMEPSQEGRALRAAARRGDARALSCDRELLRGDIEDLRETGIFSPINFGAFPAPDYDLLGEGAFRGLGVGVNFTGAPGGFAQAPSSDRTGAPCCRAVCTGYAS